MSYVCRISDQFGLIGEEKWQNIPFSLFPANWILTEGNPPLTWEIYVFMANRILTRFVDLFDHFFLSRQDL